MTDTHSTDHWKHFWSVPKSSSHYRYRCLLSHWSGLNVISGRDKTTKRKNPWLLIEKWESQLEAADLIKVELNGESCVADSICSLQFLISSRLWFAWWANAALLLCVFLECNWLCLPSPSDRLSWIQSRCLSPTLRKIIMWSHYVHGKSPNKDRPVSTPPPPTHTPPETHVDF